MESQGLAGWRQPGAVGRRGFPDGVSFMTPEKYGSVVFTTGSSDFEFAAVPEPSTWAMLGIGFAGLALAGYKRSRRDRLALALG
jgi:hypothetical protein